MSVLNKIAGTSLIIEVTRKCNLSCKHCLRGNAQNTDIDLASIDSFIKKLSGMSFFSILFTGGEPSLSPEAISFTLDCVKRNKVNIYSFSLITNGISLSDSFITACNNWIDYCVNKGLVMISKDSYHSGNIDCNYSKLSSYTFYTSTDYDLKKLGSAKSNNIGKDYIRTHYYDFYAYNNILVYKGDLVLNCDKTILYSCDFEFKDEDKFKLCKLNDFSVQLLFDLSKSNDIHRVNDCELLFNSFNAQRWIDYLSST